MIAAVGEIESSLKNNQSRIPSRGEKKKKTCWNECWRESLVGLPTVSLLLLKALISQHERHRVIKDTEMLFNRFSFALLAYGFAPHPFFNLRGLLRRRQLISQPPPHRPTVAGRKERETLVAVRKRKGMKHADKSLRHVEQVPMFRSKKLSVLRLWKHIAWSMHYRVIVTIRTSGHYIVFYHWEICTTHIHLMHSAIQR